MTIQLKMEKEEQKKEERLFSFKIDRQIIENDGK